MSAPIEKPASESNIVPSYVLADIDALLARIDEELTAQYPGDGAAAQPAHTVYIGAADATSETPEQWGAAAVAVLDRNAAVLGEFGDDEALRLVRRRLIEGPIADLRLDFEDGYGRRGDDVEDGDAAWFSPGRVVVSVMAVPIESRGDART